MIHVKLTGQFIKLAPEGNNKGFFNTDYESGLTISRLIQRLGVKELRINYSVLVNNTRKPDDYVLSDSDTVLVIPLLAGG